MIALSHSFSGSTAIAGIGATEFSKDSGRSELRLAVEAVAAALADAGIAPSEVQGMVTFSSDTNPDIDISRSLGIGDLTFFSRIHYGGGAACATIQQAALAVSSPPWDRRMPSSSSTRAPTCRASAIRPPLCLTLAACVDTGCLRSGAPLASGSRPAG